MNEGTDVDAAGADAHPGFRRRNLRKLLDGSPRLHAALPASKWKVFVISRRDFLPDARRSSKQTYLYAPTGTSPPSIRRGEVVG